MLPLGIAIGLQVRMGTVLATDVPRAKRMAAWCMGFTAVLAVLVASCLYTMRVQIVLLFSSDPEVLEGCEAIWSKLSIYIFVLYIFGINSAILRSLGMQWHLAAIVLGVCWCCALPLIVYFSIIRGGGLDVIWTILPICYTAMQVLIVMTYTINCDWEEIGRQIRNQHEKRLTPAPDSEAAHEGTPLIID